MRLVVQSSANRTFFSTIIEIDNRVVRKNLVYWQDVPDNPNTDLQRSYLAAQKSLEYVTSEGIQYSSAFLKIENRQIKKHLSGTTDPSTFELTQLKSKLVGLMTIMGVKHV